jgi:hypothetical protein
LAAKENYDNFEWCHKLPSDKAVVCIFRLFYQFLYKRPTAIYSKMPQQDSQARNKPDIPDSQQINIKDLYVFLV